MNSSIIVYWYSFLSSFPLPLTLPCFNSDILLAAHVLTADSAAKLPKTYTWCYLIFLMLSQCITPILASTLPGHYRGDLFNFQRSFRLLLNWPPCIIETKQNVSLSFRWFLWFIHFPQLLATLLTVFSILL